jgi:diguanylate cyclase (GGDEF)-like protein
VAAKGAAERSAESPPTPHAANATNQLNVSSPSTPTPTPTTSGLSRIQESVDDFQSELERFRQEIVDLDGRARQVAATSDAKALNKCLTEFESANDDFLRRQGDAVGRMREQTAGDAAADALAEHLRAAVDDHAMRVVEANGRVESLRTIGDAVQGGRELAAETTRLSTANHVMRDAFERVSLEIVHADGRTADSTSPVDELTGLGTRRHLEIALAEWRNGAANARRLLALAVVDLDHFTRVNEAYGPLVADRILQAVSQCLDRVRGAEGTALRLSGQQFALWLPDADPRAASGVVEQIRQQTESTRFQRGEATIGVTVSGSVVSVNPDDSVASALERAAGTLREAKRYGRNRTFLHEGGHPAPVVPPSLSVEPRVVEC